MKRKAKKVMTTLPNEVYVQLADYGDDDDPGVVMALVASKTKLDALEEDLGNSTAGDMVGVYELKEVVKLTLVQNVEEEVY